VFAGLEMLDASASEGVLAGRVRQVLIRRVRRADGSVQPAAIDESILTTNDYARGALDFFDTYADAAVQLRERGIIDTDAALRIVDATDQDWRQINDEFVGAGLAYDVRRRTLVNTMTRESIERARAELERLGGAPPAVPAQGPPSDE